MRSLEALRIGGYSLPYSLLLTEQTVLPTQEVAGQLDEYDMMHLAGHTEFETTRRFYLAIRDDLL